MQAVFRNKDIKLQTAIFIVLEYALYAISKFIRGDREKLWVNHSLIHIQNKSFQLVLLA